MRWKTLTLATILTMMLAPVLAAGPVPASETEARAVLMRYFSALSAGETTTLRSLMGGPLLAKRIPLLENPTYPGHLVKTYGNAQFSIDHMEVLDADIIADVSIVFDSSNTSHRQYRLHIESATSNESSAPIRIYGESEPES